MNNFAMQQQQQQQTEKKNQHCTQNSDRKHQE